MSAIKGQKKLTQIHEDHELLLTARRFYTNTYNRDNTEALQRKLEKSADMQRFYKQLGGMTHSDREKWSLKTTAHLRRLMEADLYSPSRTAMAPAVVKQYAEIMAVLNEMDARSFKRLQVKELPQHTNDPPKYFYGAGAPGAETTYDPALDQERKAG